MPYGLRVIPGKVTALSPLFHGGNEKTGSVVLLNRIKYMIGGKPVDIPFVSGNEVRGYLRRLIFEDFLNLVCFKIDLEERGGQALFHTLFSGGILESVETSESGVIDLSFKREIYENIIPARLFGFSFRNQMLEGRLKVAHMLPICKELNAFLPIKSEASFYTMLAKNFQTRRDELRLERESEEEQAVQMLVEQEVFAPGTEFFHEFIVEDPDDVAVGVVARMISLWKGKPFIGGKSSIGLGRVALDYQLASANEDEYLGAVNKREANRTLATLEASLTSKK